jgi:glycosyltransferase involved in cell wall biosynthesis
MSNSPIKLLSISHSCVISDYRQRYRELKALAGENLSLELWIPQHWQQFNREIYAEKTELESFSVRVQQPWHLPFGPHGLRNLFHTYNGLSKAIDRFQPDIVEIWAEPFSLLAAHVAHLCAKTKKKTTFIFFSAQNLPRSFPFPFSWFENHTYARAHFCWAMSQEVSAELTRRGYQGERLVLPLGIDPNVFKPREQHKEGALTIGFVGRLSREKGIMDFCQACLELQGDFRVLIVGQGNMESEVLQKMATKIAVGKAKILPKLDRDAMPAIMASLDILVVPSRTVEGVWKEQFGRVIVEAMACRVAVLGSDSGEIPNVVADSSCVFPEGDVHDLVKKLTHLIDDSTRLDHIKEQGLIKSMKEYTWRSIAKRQWSVYQKLLKDSSL